MVKYTTQSGNVYEVNPDGSFKNGNILEELVLVGGVVPGAVPERTITDQGVAFKLHIRKYPQKEDYLLFLSELDMGNGWERVNQDYVQFTLEYTHRENVRKIRTNPIKEIS